MRLLATGGLLLGVLLAGCGGGGTGPASSLPTQGPALWNPCDGLSARQVGAMFDTTFTISTGTPTTPECRFVPTTSGLPAIDANYSLVPGTIQDLIDTFGSSPDATISSPDVARADGARIITDAGQGVLAVSGFVKNGDLVQSVNVVAPRAYGHRAELLEATRQLLTALSRHAADSGLTSTSARPGTASPTRPSAPTRPTPRPRSTAR